MKKIFAICFVLMIGLALLVQPAHASASPASVVDVTVDVAPAVRSAVDAWLAVRPPVQLPFYAITYVNQRGADTFVSLAALNIATPTDTWHVTDSSVAWIGSVLVRADGSVRPLWTPEKHDLGLVKVLSMPKLAGGSSDVRFPWDSGKKMLYGEAGVHAAGGGGSYAVGFDAVDFLGGSDLGSGVASDNVYAAYAGVVDYVCVDAVTTLVRVTDETSGNSFIYAHLLNNASLVEGHEFRRGDKMGALKWGTFSDDCGHAEQQETHYHLHFGFEANSGSFRMENCILGVGTEKWTCGTKTVSPGEYIVKSAGTGGTVSSNPSFWDMFLTGFLSIWNSYIVTALPSHKTLEYTYVLFNAIAIALKIGWVMVYSNVNISHLAIIIGIGMAFKALLSIAEFIAFLFKLWKSLVPIAGA